MSELEEEYNNHYPTVFVHGFFGWGEDNKKNEFLPYWGMGSANLPDALRGMGYEVYFPTLGPQASVWERACNLYAYLYGGQADSGKIHASVHRHMRHGLVFPGAMKDLGMTPEHAKINLVGVGFGAQVVRVFADLMANGSQAERNGTLKRELSPLFEGGQGARIHSVTSIAGTNNGTLLADAVLPILDKIPKYSQTHRPKKFPIGSIFDTKGWETALSGARRINEETGDLEPDVYYFLYRSCTVQPDGNGGVVTLRGTRPAAILPAFLLGSDIPERARAEGADQSWLLNDGLVSLPGQDVPPGQAYKDVDYMDFPLEPGIWNRMPTTELDHLFWLGYGGHKRRYLAFYRRMLETFRRLPDASPNHTKE